MVRKSLAAVGAALLGITLLGSSVLAQGATPVAGCAEGTAEENTAIVTSYIEAVIAGDLESADALLHDDFSHDLTSDGMEVPNEAGNLDELTEEGAAVAAESGFEVEVVVAQGEWVAVEFVFEVPGSSVEGADPEAVAVVEGMVFARVECGEIIEGKFEFDSLGMLLQLGFEVTPPQP
jgi:hypothetical protein